jgi:chromosome segregation ATPase
LIELDPRITTLIGTNGVGKTSIARALRFIALNDWNDEKNTHVTFGQKASEVEAIVDNNIVKRVKGEGVNSYYLNGEELKAFGQGVPDSIKRVLNLREVNFQDQYSEHYWILLNSSQAAQALNQIFNLSDIDSSMTNVASQLREARSEVKIIEQRLLEARVMEEKLKWTDQANEDLKELERLDFIISAKEAKVEEYKIYISNKEQLIVRISYQQELLEKSIEITSIHERIKYLKEIIEAKLEITTLEKEICQMKTAQAEREEKLLKALKELCPLCQRSGPM